VELITPHRTINYHETRKGGQGPVWAVAPLIIIIIIINNYEFNGVSLQQIHAHGVERNCKAAIIVSYTGLALNSWRR
jgi:hypothetical protein